MPDAAVDSPHGIDNRVGGMFDNVDIIVYGHSHNPRKRTRSRFIRVAINSSRFTAIISHTAVGLELLYAIISPSLSYIYRLIISPPTSLPMVKIPKEFFA
ncbi:hypothetical protein ES708_30609 [subsurface metagenome]